jgi:glycosyltransferase involved in cell wall biosynthesis
MADEIRTSSRQFILEFEKSYRVFLKFNLGLKGRISFDRMGIYLPRIDWNQENSISAEISLKPALVFNSRITEWKGFETFINLAKHLGEEFQYILITSRMTHQNQLIESFISLPTSKVFFGKSVSNFLWEIPAIHIYPTRYGEKVKFPQSIGLNVLECLALGIPSMISEEGFESWPELQNSAAIFVTNWEIDETVRAIRKITESNPKILRTSYNSFHQFISIEQHLNQILNLFE